ncbi:hypothetical protein ALT785_320001 [Alteromonas infernus]
MKGIVVYLLTAFFINIVLIAAAFIESNSTSHFLRLVFILNCIGFVLSVTWVFMKYKLSHGVENE